MRTFIVDVTQRIHTTVTVEARSEGEAEDVALAELPPSKHFGAWEGEQEFEVRAYADEAQR
jgi:hypothetical protein